VCRAFLFSVAADHPVGRAYSARLLSVTLLLLTALLTALVLLTILILLVGSDMEASDVFTFHFYF
jgi:hypothetical protein